MKKTFIALFFIVFSLTIFTGCDILEQTFEEGENVNVIITITSNGGGEVFGGGVYEKGEVVKITAVSEDGYNFLNWTANDNVLSQDATYSFTASENLTISANFEQAQTIYTVTASTNNIAGIITGDGEYTEGELVVLRVTIKISGYAVKYWVINDEILAYNGTTYSFNIYEDTNVYVELHYEDSDIFLH